MSHPENTMKQIIERQDKKIEMLENLLLKIISMYQLKSSVDTQENQRYLFEELDKVRKL